MSDSIPSEDDNYLPDPRLKKVYLEANLLNDDGLESLCPSYTELAQDKPRYEEEETIGEGALKIVSRAFDRKTQRWVAMAQLRPDRDEEYYDHFVHEAWLIASLSHPNIIKVHDTGIASDGRPFFTMDLKGKSTLADLVKSKPERSLRELLQIFVKVCDAISYAHSKNIVHLDLKPENIQSDAFGEVMVCDWGLGKSLKNDNYKQDTAYYESGSHDNMTLFGQVKGSLGYMAPEQASPDGKKTTRTDIYSLGCILHFILTGEPPFKGSRKAVLEQTTESNVASLRSKFPNKHIPESLDAVVTKAMSLAPEDRYRSVPRFQKEIERYLSGYSTRAEKPGFFREARLFLRRNFIPTIISATALLLIGVLSTVYTQHLSHQKTVTALERNRADQLLEEVDTLDTEYSSFVEKSRESKRGLAKSMAATSRHVRDLSIFERPLAAINSSRNLANMALEQDPLCTEAHAQQFALDCLQLNYKSALKRPISSTTTNIALVYTDFTRLAETFPNFDFTRTKRPTVEELVSYIHKARTIDDSLHGHLERVIEYDQAARKNHDGYTEVIEAFLQYRYGGPQNLTLGFDETNSTLTLWSNQNISLIGQEYHWKPLLRFLTFRSLKLVLEGTFNLEDLNGQALATLDLSHSPNTHLDKQITLPLLQEITISPNQFEPEKLRKLINSHQNFKIIETQ